MRETVKLGVRLMLFAWWAGLLLAVVNAVTEEPIALNERLKADGARIAVIGDYAFEPVETDTSGYDAIQSVYAALDESGQTVGYVYELVSRGYGGDMVLSVGVRNGAVSGVSVASHAETKGAWHGGRSAVFAELQRSFAARRGAGRGRHERRHRVFGRGARRGGAGACARARRSRRGGGGMMDFKALRKTFLNGIFNENPTFRLVLACARRWRSPIRRPTASAWGWRRRSCWSFPTW